MAEVIAIGAVDDDLMFRQGAPAWLEANSDVRLVTTAATVKEYLALKPEPGIVTLDLHLNDGTQPGDNVRALVAAGHEVVVVTIVTKKEWVWETTEAGATAYITKDANGLGTLVEVVHQIAEGREPTTADHAFWLFQDDRPGRPHLTPRQSEILGMVGDGLTHEAIARRLGGAASTVATHLKEIRRKYRDAGRPFRQPADYRDWARERALDRERLDP